MAKAFSVASWNVRHFGEEATNEERVAFLADQDHALLYFEVQRVS